MIGVSPAYFFSRFTTRFSVGDIVSALPDLRKLGFDGFQLEIYFRERLPEWQRDAEGLRSAASDLGLTPTQMVAHFLLAAFESENALFSDFGRDEIKTVLEILDHFPACRVLTVPMAAFSWDASVPMTEERYRRLRDRLAEKVRLLGTEVRRAGREMALEIAPLALIGGTEGYLRLCAELGDEAPGYNFDTGHPWSGKENVAFIPARLGGRILGTHLKDNSGTENLALAPGKGTIPWDAVVEGLAAAGYTGSWDIEIACPAGDVEREYTAGREFLLDRLKAKAVTIKN